MSAESYQLQWLPTAKAANKWGPGTKPPRTKREEGKKDRATPNAGMELYVEEGFIAGR